MVSDAVLDTVVRGINEDCNNCSFASRNVADIFSCGGDRFVFNARIVNWFSVDYPVDVILDQVSGRYSNLTTPLTLSTAGFTPEPFGELVLSDTEVEVSLTVMIGSGTTGFADDFDTTTDVVVETLSSVSPIATDIIVGSGDKCTRTTVAMVIVVAAMATAMLRIGTGIE